MTKWNETQRIKILSISKLPSMLFFLLENRSVFDDYLTRKFTIINSFTIYCNLRVTRGMGRSVFQIVSVLTGGTAHRLHVICECWFIVVNRKATKLSSKSLGKVYHGQNGYRPENINRGIIRMTFY